MRIDLESFDLTDEEEDLKSSILLSLLCKSYWGDALGNPFNSQLPKLKRAVYSRENEELARIYIEESLDWLIKDGHAKEISIETIFDELGKLKIIVNVDGQIVNAKA